MLKVAENYGNQCIIWGCMIKSKCVDSIIIADVGVGTLADRRTKFNLQNKVTKAGTTPWKEFLSDSLLSQENSYWEVGKD